MFARRVWIAFLSFERRGYQPVLEEIAARGGSVVNNLVGTTGSLTHGTLLAEFGGSLEVAELRAAIVRRCEGLKVHLAIVDPAGADAEFCSVELATRFRTEVWLEDAPGALVTLNETMDKLGCLLCSIKGDTYNAADGGVLTFHVVHEAMIPGWLSSIEIQRLYEQHLPLTWDVSVDLGHRRTGALLRAHTVLRNFSDGRVEVDDDHPLLEGHAPEGDTDLDAA